MFASVALSVSLFATLGISDSETFILDGAIDSETFIVDGAIDPDTFTLDGVGVGTEDVVSFKSVIFVDSFRATLGMSDSVELLSRGTGVGTKDRVSFALIVSFPNSSSSVLSVSTIVSFAVELPSGMMDGCGVGVIEVLRSIDGEDELLNKLQP